MKIIKELIIIHLIILLILILSNVFGFRVCLFYNIFHLPCPGCGIVRASTLVLQGQFIESFNYSFMHIIILLLYFIIICWNIYDYIKNQNTFNFFINKHKIMIIIITTCIMLFAWYINLNNPLLY